MLPYVIAIAIWLLAAPSAQAEPKDQRQADSSWGPNAAASAGATAGATVGADGTAASDATEAAVLSGLEEMCRSEGWGFWWDGKRCLTNEETLSLSREEALKLIRWRYRGGQTF